MHIEETLYVLFLITVDELLEKYNKTWGKVRNSTKKKNLSEAVCNKKYLRTKMNFYNGKINTIFHSNKIPKEGSQYLYLTVVLINSVYRKAKNFYPQVFLEKYIVKEKTMSTFIIDDIEISFGDLVKKILMKKTQKYRKFKYRKLFLET